MRQDTKAAEDAATKAATQLEQRNKRIEALQREVKELKAVKAESARAGKQLQQEIENLKSSASKHEDTSASLDARVASLTERLARADADLAAARESAATEVCNEMRFPTTLQRMTCIIEPVQHVL